MPTLFVGQSGEYPLLYPGTKGRIPSAAPTCSLGCSVATLSKFRKLNSSNIADTLSKRAAVRRSGKSIEHIDEMSRHYAKAPIAEAVIDLHIDPAIAVDSVALEEVAAQLSDFPKRLPLTGIQMGFVGGLGAKEPQFHSKHEPVGFRLETANGNRVLLLQKRSFTFSHLPPYSSWKEFRVEAVNLWRLYVEATKAETVTRLAVRVINKLQLPATLSELSTYSNILPHVPDRMPLEADTFFMQFQAPLDQVAENCRAIVNVGSSQSKGGKFSELLLDFDLFIENRISAAEHIVFPLLDKLSEGKNELFEACVTDATRDLIR